ncbi:hypothetical protein AVEN_105531-1, partial [Araneus ventricosus]
VGAFQVRYTIPPKFRCVSGLLYANSYAVVKRLHAGVVRKFGGGAISVAVLVI